MTVDDWDYREVCPDGSCVGVIGPEGQCKVCGRVSPTWSNERERGMVVDGEADPDADVAGDDDEEDDDEYEDDEEAGDDEDLDPAAPADDAEWSRRQLCPDGACVGVVGPSGACTVCGKTFTA